MIIAAIVLRILFKSGYIHVELLGQLVKRPIFITGIICLLVLAFPLCALRWYFLLRIQGIYLRYIRVFKVYYLSTFLGLFLPGAVGGDAIRITLGSTLLPKQKVVLALSVFIDRLIGAISLFSLTIIALIIFLVQNRSRYGVDVLFISVGIVLIALLISFLSVRIFSTKLRYISRTRDWQKGNFVQRLIANITESIILYRNCPRQLALCLSLSLVVHVSRLLVIYILAISMGMGGVNVVTYVLAGSMSLLANFIPITPGGIGIGEAAFAQIIGTLAMVNRQGAYGTVILAIRALDAVLLFPAIMMRFKKVRCHLLKTARN